MKYTRRGMLAPTKAELITPFDTLINQMLNDAFPAFNKSFGEDFFVKGAYPKVNVMDKEDSVVIEAAVPGLGKEDIDLELKEDNLTIRGKSMNHSSSNLDYVRREIKRSSFQRTFSLGQNLDQNKISASCDAGILTIQIPKIVEEEKLNEPIKIAIE